MASVPLDQDLDALADLHNDPGRWNTRDLGNNLRKNANDDEMPEDPVLSDPEEEEERHEEDTEETAPKKRSGYGCQISRGYKALWREIDQLPSKMLDPNIANLMKKVLRAIDEDDEVFCRKDGTVNINVFDWLFKEDLMKDMLEELAMYKHYLRLLTIIRQDVLYYLAYVCLRPDYNQQLVSYPYYCKYATGASKTEFRHLDNHPDCLLAGDGANMIQGTMSLVDETKDNLSQAIVGRTTWADPRTLTERAILFGTDDEKRKKFIDECHADAARKFRVCFRATMDAEARYYPMKSYDRYKQGYGEVSSDDELVESVSSEESSGKDTGGKGEGEGSAMNIFDENDSSESPRGGASDMDTD
ncbi:hypothetical protein H2203_001647 [Taxawa tesnikishii (nom. ined.)]|nr:hypothetical protein H2203_001647 [Dothideales sp. JES 119]